MGDTPSPRHALLTAGGQWPPHPPIDCALQTEASSRLVYPLLLCCFLFCHHRDRHPRPVQLLPSVLSSSCAPLHALLKFTTEVLFYSTILGVCAALQPSKTFPAIFYAPAFFEAFVFALTAYRGFQDAKMIAGTETAPFLKVFYRGWITGFFSLLRFADCFEDGFICFFVMIALRMWNIWIVRIFASISLACGNLSLTRSFQYLTQPLSSFNLGTQCVSFLATIS